MKTGDTVDEVLSGQASKRDARGQRDSHDLRAEIDAIDQDIARRRARLQVVQARLSDLNAERSGKKMPTGAFKNLMNERAELVNEQAQLMLEIAQDKQRRKALAEDLPPENDQWAPKFDTMIDLLRGVLVEVRRIRLNQEDVKASPPARTPPGTPTLPTATRSMRE